MKYSKELMCKYLLTDRTCPELILANDCADFASGNCVIFAMTMSCPKRKNVNFFWLPETKKRLHMGGRFGAGGGGRPENFLRAKLWDFKFLNHCVSDTWKFSCSSSSIGCIY
jgi:hypothetical protein